MATVVLRGKKPHSSGRRWDMVTLRAASALTEDSGEVSNVFDIGDYDFLTVIQHVTLSATDAGDTLNTKIDGSWDGTNFYNMGEFTEKAGNSTDLRVEIMQFARGLAADVDAIVDISGDAGAAVVRPGLLPPFIRTTSVVVRATGTDESHTFSVYAYVQ